jgi:hypothetical protein
MTKTVTSLQLTGYRHGADDVRTYPPASGGGGGSPIVLPLYAGFFGDSNTAGRSDSMLPAKSPHQVFIDIYLANGGTAFAATPTINGVSGRSLQSTLDYLAGRSFAGRPWVHIEESGNQNGLGQETPIEYGATMEAGIRAAYTRWPDALFTVATSPNFGRANGEQWRDWKTTLNWADWGYLSEGAAISYNDELIRRVGIMAADGIDVLVIDVAPDEDALAAIIAGGATTLYSDTNPYHWSPVGRLMQALRTFHALGYDVNALDLDGETVHTNSTTDAQYKADCLAIINA